MAFVTDRAEASQTANLVERVDMSATALKVALSREAVAEATGLESTLIDEALLLFVAPIQLRRRGVEMKIITGDLAPAPDETLIKALRNAHRWAAALRRGTTLSKLAAEEGHSERYLARITHLSGLSPRVQTAILRGEQPADLTLEKIIRRPLRLSWKEQEALLLTA
ncbi:MAG TPA: hypothetical protein VLA27_08840 [Paracoccaceae bacterium]|nr:hypothetical protein [Paracoccaceae bacterium]